MLALPAIPAARADPLDDKIHLTVGAPAPTITEDNYKLIAYNSTFAVTLNLSLSCRVLAQHADNPKFTASLLNPPTWLTASSVVFDFTPTASYQPCTPATDPNLLGTVGMNRDFPIHLAASAPGIRKQYLNFTAASTANPGGTKHTSDPATLPQPGYMQVQFHPDYTVTTSVAFPLAVHNCEAHFTATFENRANARGMIMFEKKTETPGSLSGLTPEVYDPPAKGGVDRMVFNITYKAPSGWTEGKASFQTVSHWLLNTEYGAGEMRGRKDNEWTFTNADPGATCTDASGTTDPGKTSPVPMLPLYILSLVGAALAANRRTR